MDAGGANVITTLRDRWSLEQEIQAMLGLRSESEFSAQAQRLATSGEQVIPVLLSQLDQADGRFVGVLGTVASLYPDRQEIINKLTQAAESRARPDRGRVSAILILERFLEQDVDPYLFDTLNDPSFMAVESIREMIREGEREPRAWIEYTRSLVEQPPEMVWDVMETLLEIGGERAVPALCLLAQEDAETVGEAALHTLGRLSGPTAAQGLQSILPLLPPDRQALARRSLLKLQLKQVQVDERLDPHGCWRTLVGPPDGHGDQVVWFFHTPDEQGRTRFLGLSVHELDGIRQAYGHHDVLSAMGPDAVPEPLPVGHVHRVLLPGSPDGASVGARLLMLETDFEYGRRLVRDAQERSLAAGQSLPIEYRLMGPWLWHYRESATETRVEPAVFESIAAPSASLEASVGLLYHAAFRGWFADGEWLLRPAAVLLGRLPRARVSRLGEVGLLPGELDGLTRTYFEPPMVERLQGRLRGMAEWLARADEGHTAALAWAAAQALSDVPPERHPFARAMVELGLQMMVEQLRSLQ